MAGKDTPQASDASSAGFPRYHIGGIGHCLLVQTAGLLSLVSELERWNIVTCRKLASDHFFDWNLNYEDVVKHIAGNY